MGGIGHRTTNGADVSGGTPAVALRTRLMPHPGPVAPDRFTIARHERASPARVHLPAGVTLLDALRDTASALGGGQEEQAVVFTLIHGGFAPCVHCLATADPTGHTLATYTPWQTRRAVEVLGGSATFGISVDGAPMVHCHAWFSDPDAGTLAGGHLDSAATVLGPRGLVVLAWGLGAISVRQTSDAETNHAVFMPRECRA